MQLTQRLYLPVGQTEMALIKKSGYRSFPSRVNGLPLFYPVFNRKDAAHIARNWHIKDAFSGFMGYVTRFEVDRLLLEDFEQRIADDRKLGTFRVPAEELQMVNQHIRGRIKVVDIFYGKLDPVDNISYAETRMYRWLH